jgi:phosphatidylinositol alpha-mannosyltransferase
MKVLQVCPYDFARPGGVQRHIRDLSHALRAAGHAVTIAAPGPGAGADAHYIGSRRPWRMHGTGFELTWAPRVAIEDLARQAFDVVHLHTPWVPFMPWQVLRRLAPMARARVATFHDTPPHTVSGEMQRAVYKVLSRRLSHRLDAMIAVSASVERHLRARGECARYRLPPCIDLAPYSAVTRRDGGSAILFVGRLEPRKGVLLLIEALARLPGAKLIVCGDGPQRGAAEALARAKGVAVRFTGALDDAGKLAFYGEADVLCAPSPYGESYGLVIAEAMAAGLPVVAGANDGYRAVLDGDGAAGLCEPGSVPALAERLAEVLTNRALRQRLSAWGRREALRADMNERLSDFLAIYERSNGLGRGNQRSSSARR